MCSLFSLLFKLYIRAVLGMTSFKNMRYNSMIDETEIIYSNRKNRINVNLNKSREELTEVSANACIFVLVICMPLGYLEINIKMDKEAWQIGFTHNASCISCILGRSACCERVISTTAAIRSCYRSLKRGFVPVIGNTNAFRILRRAFC